MSVQNSVFVGNIPYEATEAQLKDFLDQIGGVVTFKLQYDDKSGKSMGYGFCEFKDKEHAEMAIKCLNGGEFQGRNLIVGKKHGKKNRQENVTNNNNKVNQPRKMTTNGEGINNILKEKMNDKQLLQILAQFKSLIQQNPGVTQHILQSNPQLTYALLQAQVILGIAPNVVQEIMKMKSTPSNTINRTNIQPNPNISLPSQQQYNTSNLQTSNPNIQPTTNPLYNYYNNAPKHVNINPVTMASVNVMNPIGTHLVNTPTVNVSKQEEQLVSFLSYILNTPTQQITNCTLEQQVQILDVLKKIVVNPVFTSLTTQQQTKVYEVITVLSNKRN
eukprot:TRINITY_DN5528_c0_g1_i1.p1 TRINITY_DN5528_c0_g1~~TRINITY_DN5528_c0_g1_i1.p1  ORF type:complete len:331 (+),score=103.85 TRINITY_DN5528_c0_g1_i1:214-1206(+)